MAEPEHKMAFTGTEAYNYGVELAKYYLAAGLEPQDKETVERLIMVFEQGFSETVLKFERETRNTDDAPLLHPQEG